MTPQSRQAFVEAIIQIFKKYPGLFNRVDIDWEHISPAGKNYGDAGNEVRAEDPANFAAFLELLRNRLDAERKGHYEISACVVGDPAKMEALPLQAMARYLTTINVMTVSEPMPWR
jgi:chitinase